MTRIEIKQKAQEQIQVVLEHAINSWGDNSTGQKSGVTEKDGDAIELEIYRQMDRCSKILGYLPRYETFYK